MDPLFSILLPSRERKDYLKYTVQEMLFTAGNRDNIEIIVIMDTDDTATLNLIPEFEKMKNVFIKIRPPGNSLVDHYFNWGVQFTKGKYIMIGDDDSLFKSKNWDINSYNILEEFLKDKPDGVVCAVVDDGIAKHLEHGRQYNCIACSFPIISRKAIDALGFMLDPRFVHESADLDIILTYTAINRIVDLRSVFKAIHMDIKYIEQFGTILLTNKNTKSSECYKEFTPYNRGWIKTGQFTAENTTKLLRYIESYKNDN